MKDRYAELDAALDRVVAAARAHLAAVKAAGGEPDDDRVWHAYVALNNASHEYDEQLDDAFGEVTPWDVEAISPGQAEGSRIDTVVSGQDAVPAPADDPYEYVVSVRQRRDYRVPSLNALIQAAEADRASVPEAEPAQPVRTAGEAIIELLQSGDWSLGMLDVPELDPLDGVVVVAEVDAPLDPEALDESDGEAPFRLGADERVVGRLYERSLLDLEP